MKQEVRSHRLQLTLKPQAWKVLEFEKKEMEVSVMQKLPDSVPVNKIILEWDDLRKLKEVLENIKKEMQIPEEAPISNVIIELNNLRKLKLKKTA